MFANSSWVCVCTHACPLRDVWAQNIWCWYAMSWAQREIFVKCLSFGALLLCERDNYKHFKLFINFLLYTHEPMAYKHQREKISKYFTPCWFTKVNREIFTNFHFLTLVYHHEFQGESCAL